MSRMTLVMALLGVLVSFSSTAEEQKAATAKPKSTVPRPTLEQMQRVQMKAFGGVVVDRRQQRGKVVVVNAQTAADEKWIVPQTKMVAVTLRIGWELKKGTFDLLKPETVGEATLFVVDDPALPISLLAPEARWAMVNIAPLKTDKPAFFESRVKKAVVRGLALLLGASNSQSAESVMKCLTSVADYDSLVSTRLPPDVIMRMRPYAEGYGITQYKLAKYKDAVQEGWAAQPTNEYQKAVWDSVHALPTNPIKIKYDPKRDK